MSSKGENKTNLSLVIDVVDIVPANNVNVIGITIPQCLKFTKHKSDMCSKAGRKLKVLQRVWSSLDFNGRIAIY